MNDIQIVAIEVTGKCNLNCSFCVRNASSNNTEQISFEQYENILQLLMNLDHKPSIAITGGEPFIHKDLNKIIQITIEYGFKFSINTNGTIYDEEILEICKNTELFKYFIISLDSYNESTHNEIRGSKVAFKNTVEFINILKSQKLKFSLNMTVNHKNLYDIDQTVKLAEKLGAEYISVSSVKPGGRGKLELNFDQMKIIAEQIKKNQYLISDKFKLFIAEATFFLYDMDNYKEGIKNNEEWSCAFGHSSIHIRVNGDILGCTTCDLVLDNIFVKKDFNVEEFWKSNHILNKVRSKKFLTGYCKTCKYTNFCGGCRCRAYALTGDLLGDDLYCPLISNNNMSIACE